MKLRKRQLQEIIYRTLGLINEGMVDKILSQVSDNPDWNDSHKEKIEKAYSMGITKRPQLEWLAYFYLQYPDNDEEIEDIVKTMKDFNRFNAKIKKLELESDMTKYESPSALRSSVMLSQGKVSKADLAKESTHLGKFGGYDLYLPHTREASCTLGEGTSWCTAIPGKGNNLFYNYVAKLQAAMKYGGDVYLFYLIGDESVEKNTPSEYTKMSLGYVNDGIRWPKEYSEGGGLTVTSKNNGLTEKGAQNVLGGELMNVENAIEKYVSQRKSEGKSHPAKDKFMQLASNPILLQRELQGSSPEVREDTLDMVRSIYKHEAQENTRGTLRQGSRYHEKPIYPPGIKEFLFDTVKKIFYGRATMMAKRAYEYHDTYSVTLAGFIKMVEHPDGDMFEPRYASIEILEDILGASGGRKGASLSEDEVQDKMHEEYFKIITSAGLELFDTKSGKVLEDHYDMDFVDLYAVNVDRKDK